MSKNETGKDTFCLCIFNLGKWQRRPVNMYYLLKLKVLDSVLENWVKFGPIERRRLWIQSLLGENSLRARG